jgi:hypothetical protein
VKATQNYSDKLSTINQMIPASNLRFLKLATTRNDAAWQALLRPALASHSSVQSFTSTNNYVRYNATVATTDNLHVKHYSSTGFVEKPLKVLDSVAVERIKQELADVDVNSDGRYVTQNANSYFLKIPNQARHSAFIIPTDLMQTSSRLCSVSTLALSPTRKSLN